NLCRRRSLLVTYNACCPARHFGLGSEEERLMKTNYRIPTAALSLLLGIGLIVGCSRSRDDAQVASDVQGKINADSNIQNKQITVNANKGVVTLSGTVNNDLERSSAANDASQ